MRWLSRAVVGIWLLVGAGMASAGDVPTGASEAAPAGDRGLRTLLEALPSDLQEGIRAEGALLVPDLRAVQDWLAARRRRLARFSVGRAEQAGRTPGSVDLLAQLTLLGELAGANPPGGIVAATSSDSGPAVPAAITTFLVQGRPGVQFQIRVAPGFEERVARLDTQAAGWSLAPQDSGYVFSTGEHSWPALLDEQGWLRVAPDESMLGGGRSPSLGVPFDGEWIANNSDSRALLFVRGEGPLAAFLRTLLPESKWTRWLTDMGNTVLRWSGSDARSGALELSVDAPNLEKFGQPSPGERDAGDFDRLWGPAALGYAHLNVSPELLSDFRGLARAAVAELRLPPSPSLQTLLEGLTGRFSIANFGPVGDWAVAATTPASGDADGEAMTEQFREWLRPGDLEAADAVAQSGNRAPNTFALRPSLGPGGARIGVLGEYVVIANSGRWHRLRQDDDRPPPSLTPTLARILSRPAQVIAYTVLGDEGTALRWLGWISGAASRMVRLDRLEGRIGDAARWLVDRVPVWLALGEYQWSLLYDIAATLQVTQGRLIVTVAGSDV